MEVGVLGLGAMGAPMAARLAGGGHRVIGWNRSAVEVTAGVEQVASPAEVARLAGTVLVMVTGPEAVEEVLFGVDGWAQAAPANGLVLQSSTIGPTVTRDLARRLEGQGLRLVDAPVSGSVDAATSGQLNILAGGSAKDLAELGPVLDLLAQKVIHAGPVGAGSALKLVVNSVLISSIAATAEAMDWLAHTEPTVDAEVATQALERVAPLAARRIPKILAEPGPASFKLTHAAKDLDLLGATSPNGVLEATRTLAREAAQRYPDNDMSGLGAAVRARR